MPSKSHKVAHQSERDKPKPIADNETQASDGKSNTAEDESNKTKQNIFINDRKNTEDTREKMRNPLAED